MERTERVIFTNMCMVCDGKGNVLVEDRRESDWRGVTFPGGHVEEGEAFTDAAAREVFEETGLTVRRLRLCGVKDWMQEDGARYVVFCYRTEDFGGDIRSSEEGRVFWTPLATLGELKLAETLSSMLRVFCDDAANELFYTLIDGKWIETVK